MQEHEVLVAEACANGPPTRVARNWRAEPVDAECIGKCLEEVLLCPRRALPLHGDHRTGEGRGAVPVPARTRKCTWPAPRGPRTTIVSWFGSLACASTMPQSALRSHLSDSRACPDLIRGRAGVERLAGASPRVRGLSFRRAPRRRAAAHVLLDPGGCAADAAQQLPEAGRCVASVGRPLEVVQLRQVRRNEPLELAGVCPAGRGSCARNAGRAWRTASSSHRVQSRSTQSREMRKTAASEVSTPWRMRRLRIGAGGQPFLVQPHVQAARPEPVCEEPR